MIIWSIDVEILIINHDVIDGVLKILLTVLEEFFVARCQSFRAISWACFKSSGQYSLVVKDNRGRHWEHGTNIPWHAQFFQAIFVACIQHSMEPKKYSKQFLWHPKIFPSDFCGMHPKYHGPQKFFRATSPGFLGAGSKYTWRNWERFGRVQEIFLGNFGGWP